MPHAIAGSSQISRAYVGLTVSSASLATSAACARPPAAQPLRRLLPAARACSPAQAGGERAPVALPRHKQMRVPSACGTSLCVQHKLRVMLIERAGPASGGVGAAAGPAGAHASS